MVVGPHKPVGLHLKRVELAVMTDIMQDVDEQANKCNTGLGENNSN
jgi:hypothetical protein